MISTRSRAFLWGVVGANVILTVLTQMLILHSFPNSGDEYVQSLQAEMYAQGRLWVQAPEPHEFFRVSHALNHGRFYGKYSPGWPAIQAVGVLAGVPWLVNPLFGSFTLLLLHRLACERVSRKAGNLLLLAAAFNPFFVFTSASYYSHATCLFAVVALWWTYLKFLDEPATRRWPMLAGAAAGLALLIRPYTAAAVILPFAIHLGWRLLFRRAQGPRWSQIFPGVATFGVFVALFLGYNLALTGDALLQPFSQYDPKDRPRLLMSGSALEAALRLNLMERFLELNQWIPLVGFFVFYWARSNRDGWIGLGLLSSLSLFTAYFFYPAADVDRYGPRYVYELTGFLFIVIARVLDHLPRFGPVVLAVFIGLNGYVGVEAARMYSGTIRERKRVFDLAKERRLSDAVVFLGTGSGDMERGALTRNGITFDAPVLYVHDLGVRNRRLLKKYPGRAPYYYRYDSTSKSAELLPMLVSGGGP